MSLLGLIFAASTVTGHVALPARRSAPVPNERYEIVSRAGILATNPPLAVVYLAGPFPLPAGTTEPEMAQRGLAFVPTLLPIQAGTRVSFPNYDDTYHNIFSYSAAKRFDLGRYRSDERPIPSVLFDTPGLVTLHCDIHEHMRALILVLDTPYFVLTRPDGSFRLTGLPPGKHVLKAWVDSRTTREQPVALADGATSAVDFP
jgi:plastocyanin